MWGLFAAVVLLAAIGAPGAAVRSTTDLRRLRGRGTAGRRTAHFASRAQRGSEDEQLEAWVDSGLAVASAMEAEKVAKAVEPITEASYKEMLKNITQFQSRFIAERGNAEVASLLKKRFSELGLDVVEQEVESANFERQRYMKASDPEPAAARTGNVIAVLKGTDLSDELVVFGAHFDSVNWEDTSGPSPGVDDNGSGIAAVLLAARALSGLKLRRSVAFVGFQGEEEGTFGSNEFVAGPVAQGEYGKLVAAVIADEVAYGGRPEVARKAIFETVGRSSKTAAIVDTLAHSAQSEEGIAGFEVNYNGFGSDHIPFLDAGYPAVLLIERDDEYHADTWGHSARDTFEHVDMGFGAAMTRLATRVILTLASPKSDALG